MTREISQLFQVGQGINKILETLRARDYSLKVLQQPSTPSPFFVRYSFIDGELSDIMGLAYAPMEVRFAEVGRSFATIDLVAGEDHDIPGPVVMETYYFGGHSLPTETELAVRELVDRFAVHGNGNQSPISIDNERFGRKVSLIWSSRSPSEAVEGIGTRVGLYEALARNKFQRLSARSE